MYTGYTLDVYAPYTPINTQHRPLVQVLTWILKFYLITCDRSGYFPTYNSTNKVTYFNPTRIKPVLRILGYYLIPPVILYYLQYSSQVAGNALMQTGKNLKTYFFDRGEYLLVLTYYYSS